MRQVERVVLWAAVAGLTGWHLGAAVAGPKKDGGSLAVTVSAMRDRLAGLEQYAGSQSGHIAPYWWLKTAAERWEKAAADAPDSIPAMEWRAIARELREAAEPFKAQGELQLAEAEERKRKAK